MSSRLASLLVAAILGPALSAAPLALDDPGFERSPSPWSIRDPGAAVSSLGAEAARSGALGLCIRDSDTALGSSIESAALPAVPGRVYRLSFFARSPGRSPGCGVYLRFRDTEDRLMPGAPACAIPPDAADWTPLSLEATAPAGAASVSVWVHSFSTTTGLWHVDDLALEEAGSAPATPPPAAVVKAAATTPSAPAVLPEPRVPVVLKLDDLIAARDGTVPDRWRRLTDFARARGLKVSIGVICDSLEGDKPAYFGYIKELHSSGLCELWFHGYDHKQWTEGERKLAEFNGSSYEHQKDHFVKSQALARAKLGFAFATFGAPFNATDSTTVRVLAEDPDIKVVLFGNSRDHASGKRILDRVGPVNLEIPLFIPNPEKFAEAYAAHAKGRKYYVLQGHPGQWDDARWAAFVRFVDFLQQNQIPVLTPSELVSTL